MQRRWAALRTGERRGPRSVWGRPPRVKTAARRYAAGLRPGLDPRAPAAPPVRKSGQAAACPQSARPPALLAGLEAAGANSEMSTSCAVQGASQGHRGSRHPAGQPKKILKSPPHPR